MTMDRRRFLQGAGATVTGLVAACSRKQAAVDVRQAAAAAPIRPGTPTVAIVAFDDKGTRGATEDVARVVRTDAEWHEQLSDLEFDVTRREGTERAFTGPLLEEHRRGVF